MHCHEFDFQMILENEYEQTDTLRYPMVLSLSIALESHALPDINCNVLRKCEVLEHEVGR